jgi:glutamate synthase domain-containing protein 3
VSARCFDLSQTPVRELNAALHEELDGEFKVLEPGGRHAIAVGANGEAKVEIDGHVGYYCGGMNQRAAIRVRGNCGVGVAENMMSGRVVIEGDASQAAGATAHGGLLAIEGNASARCGIGDASSRCGISMKGVDIVVRGSVGHMSAFMAQSGRLLVCGDAGEALGDSIYEARIYVRGEVTSLGADCVEKDLRDEHRQEVAELLAAAGIDDVEAGEFRRYGSARQLYNFDVDNAAVAF